MKRSKFSEEQIVRILQEAARGEKSHQERRKDHGVTTHTVGIFQRAQSLSDAPTGRIRSVEPNREEDANQD